MTKPFRPRIAGLWCNFTHPAPLWPSRSHDRRPACLRQYPAPWERRSWNAVSQVAGGWLNAEALPVAGRG